MKRFFYILASLALVSVGCNKIQPDVNDIPTDGNIVSFKATIEAPIDDTRASVSTSTGVFGWTDEDKIAVQLTNDNFKEFTYSTSTGEFTASLGAGEAIKDGGVAYYPASIAINGTPGSVRLPDTYTAAEAEAGFPMIAPVALGATTLAFTHLGGLLTLTVSYVPADAEELVLTVPGVKVTGDFAVSSNQISAGASNSTVTLTFAKGAYAASAHEFVIPMPVATFTGGFTLQFKNAANDVLFEKTATKTTISVARAALKKMSSITVPKYIYLNTSNPWSGVVSNTYLYIYSATANNSWPGVTSSGSYSHDSKTYSRFEVSADLSGSSATLLFNGGNVSADGGYGVEDFTRAQVSGVTLNGDLYFTLSEVAQAKTTIYFRDNNGQQYNWEYNLYAWNRDNESELLFGSFNGIGKSNSNYFSWAAAHDDVWYGSFQLEKNFKLGLIIVNPDGTTGKHSQTGNINIDCTASNYVVVTDNAQTIKVGGVAFPSVGLTQD